MKIYLLALKQIFTITFTILLFITLPVVLFTLISSRIPIYGISSFVVLSGSMEPAVPVGSVIYTLKLPQYETRDVVAFKQGKNTITHRIVEVTKDGYRTKGDANEDPDTALVSLKDVVGNQVFMLWNLGKLIIALKTIPGFLVLLVLPALILIGSEFWNIKKEFEKEVKKKFLQEISRGANVIHSGSVLR